MGFNLDLRTLKPWARDFSLSLNSLICKMGITLVVGFTKIT